MTSSSRLTRRSSRAWALVGLAAPVGIAAPVGLASMLGLAVLAAGCARTPVSRPTAVYVNAASLARSHPKWAAVTALDQQIAWLSAYRPRPVAPPRLIPASFAVAGGATSGGGTVNLSALRRTIETTLDAVRQRQKTMMEARLTQEQQRTRLRTAEPERAAIADEAQKRFNDILDRRGEELANLDVKLHLVDSLQKTYAARGANWAERAQQMADERTRLQQAIVSAQNGRRDEMTAVFDWIKDQFSAKEQQETAAVLQNLRAHQAEIDALDRNIDEQKVLLLDALQQVAPPPAAPAASGGPAARVAALAPGVAEPPLPAPRLEARVAALRARRARLVGFIMQNTEAVVKAAARRQDPPLEPVFARMKGPTPDRTEMFRQAVSDPTDALRAMTAHGPL